MRRCFKTQKSNGVFNYYYTDNDQLIVSLNNCIDPLSLGLILDANATIYNTAQTCTEGTATPTQIVNQPAPSWLSALVSYNLSAYELTIEGNPNPDGESIQLKFERNDGVGLSGSNSDGPILTSGQFYGAGNQADQNGYILKWVFGKSANGNGGIPPVLLKLSFKRVSTNEVYVYYFTPPNVTRAILFGQTSTPTPTNTPTPTQTSTIPNTYVRQGYSWDSATGNRSYTIFGYVTDNATYQARLIPLDNQTNVSPSYSAMEVGSWAGPNGITWNRRKQLDPIFIGGTGVDVGRWKQSILNLSTTQLSEVNVTLVAGQNVSNQEITSSNQYYSAGNPVERDVTDTTTPTSTNTPTPTNTGNLTLDTAAGTQQTYSGTLNQAKTTQSDTSFLNITVGQFANGLISFLDTATNQPGNGLLKKYLIENNRFVDSLNGLFFDPAYPILIQLFWVNSSASIYDWQSSGAKAYSQIIID